MVGACVCALCVCVCAERPSYTTYYDDDDDDNNSVLADDDDDDARYPPVFRLDRFTHSFTHSPPR